MTNEKYNQILDRLREIIKGTKFQGNVFTVGGCNRDSIMGNEIKDIDLCVSMPNGGIDFAKWLEENNFTTSAVVTYENFGTAMFRLKDFPDVELEAVHTRKECYHDAKTRNPETSYGSLNEDWTRRDFTINAIYHDISNNLMVDFHERGYWDIQNQIIRTCSSDPSVVFDEDPLRILRMVRFAGRLHFEIDEKTFNSAKKNVDRLSIISTERIHDEFMKMCSVVQWTNFRRAMEYLWDLKAFKYIIPYLDMDEEGISKMVMKLYYVWKYSGSPSLERLFAALLSDDENAEEDLRNLKCTNTFIKKVMFIINQNKKLFSLYSNEDYDENESFIFRKFMYECKNSETLGSVCMIGDEKMRNYFFTQNVFKTLVDENRMFYTFKLPINGDYVMNYFNIGPSEEVKKILDKCLNFCFANPYHLTINDIINFLNYIKYEKKD